MNSHAKSRIPEILKNYEADLLAEWIREQVGAAGQQAGRIKEAELREQCGSFLRLLQEATQGGNSPTSTGPEWNGVRELLGEMSRSGPGKDSVRRRRRRSSSPSSSPSSPASAAN